jgi:esterase/lipase superfamily enzyme
MFGPSKGELAYGSCEVSMPTDHRMGELESPSILRLEFRANPAKHVVLLNVTSQQKQKFFADIIGVVKNSRRKSAFIFVHGYRVTFEDAARRTAQMAHDLEFDGAPIFYSWPSQGTLSGYPADENNIEWSQKNLKYFLADFTSRTDAENIFLIAHSMGSRSLIGAFTQLIAEKPASRFREIILAAPDIDADIFKRDIAPQIPPATLYVSSHDEALGASKKFHKSLRAGDSGAGPIVYRGIDTVDAANVTTDLFGHSYLFGRPLLQDMFYLIRDGKRADDRAGLKAIETPAGP